EHVLMPKINSEMRLQLTRSVKLFSFNVFWLLKESEISEKHEETVPSEQNYNSRIAKTMT
ncbi:8105_t:CDS:2, partial [Scutellospora calospora]